MNRSLEVCMTHVKCGKYGYGYGYPLHVVLDILQDYNTYCA